MTAPDLLTMSRKELDRAEWMQRVHEQRMTQADAAERLGLSVRQVERLYRAYKAGGAVALTSKKRGRPSSRRLPDALRAETVGLVREKYGDFGPTLACEKLVELHGIDVSVETLRQWMIGDGVWLPRNRRLPSRPPARSPRTEAARSARPRVVNCVRGVKNAREESFDFLGYTFEMMRSLKTGAPYPGAMPGMKAVKRFKENVRRWLFRSNVRPLAMVVAVLNRKLRGWGNYFRYGSVLRTRQKLDRFVWERVRHFLVRRNKCRTRGTRRYSWEYVFGELGVVSLNALPRPGM